MFSGCQTVAGVGRRRLAAGRTLAVETADLDSSTWALECTNMAAAAVVVVVRSRAVVAGRPVAVLAVDSTFDSRTAMAIDRN